MSVMSQTGLYDVIDLILDKGLVIDAFLRVSVISIDLLTIDARVVVAGVDTYLRFAEAANRLEIGAGGQSPLTGLLGGAARGLGQGKGGQPDIIGGGVQPIRERSK
jgi:gas vesicle structural protein